MKTITLEKTLAVFQYCYNVQQYIMCFSNWKEFEEAPYYQDFSLLVKTRWYDTMVRALREHKFYEA